MHQELASALPLIKAVHEFERAIRSTLAAGGKVTATATEAQLANEDRLGVLGGYQAIAPFMEAQAHIGRAMTSLAEGHRKLSQLGKSMGYRFDDDGSSGFGDSRKSPDTLVSILTGFLAQERSTQDAAH